jgi:hypothetical protein
VSFHDFTDESQAESRAAFALSGWEKLDRIGDQIVPHLRDLPFIEGQRG